MESPLPENALNPGILVDVHAVDALVSVTADGDEGHSILEGVVNSSHLQNLDDSKSKAVSIQQFKHKDFRFMKVYVQSNQISEVLHPLRSINDENVEKLRLSIYFYVL